MSKKGENSIGSIKHSNNNNNEKQMEKDEFETRREKYKEEAEKRQSRKQGIQIACFAAGSGIVTCIFWFAVITLIGLLFA